MHLVHNVINRLKASGIFPLKEVFFAIAAALLFLPSSVSAARIYEQLDFSTLDSANCQAASGSTAGCGEFVGSKTHSEYATTSAAVTASPVLYASFYAGMDGGSYGSFLSNPQISVVSTDGTSCNMSGFIPEDFVDLIRDSTLSNPAFISNVELTPVDVFDCTFSSTQQFTFNFGAGNWNGQIASYTDGSGVRTKDFFILSTSPDVPDTRTRIIDVTPHEGDQIGSTDSTVAQSVVFSLHAYINPDDVGSFFSVNLSLRNIDQNVALISEFSPSSFIFLADVQATTTGDFYYSETRLVPHGNYMVNAVLHRTYGLWGVPLIENPFAAINDERSNQFVVGKATFIGQITQNLIRDMNAIASSTTATSTAALASSCNPFSGDFDVLSCGSFLFIPSPTSLVGTKESFELNLANRAPWGYVTRFVNIMASTTAVEPIPLTYTFGSSSPAVLDGRTYSINVFDEEYLGKIATVRTDDGENKNIWDIVNPYFTMVVSVAILLMILADILAFDYSGYSGVASGLNTDIHMGGGGLKIKRVDAAADRRRLINARSYDRNGDQPPGVIH